MSVKIVYQDIAPGAAEDASVAASGEHAYSDPSLLPFGAGNGASYVTLEKNRWLLDGSFDFYDGGAVSFWSDALSDDDGAFSTPPTITIDFDERYTSLGIYLESGGDAWISALSIAWYQGSTELASEDFTPDGLSYFCEHAVTAYDRVVLTIRKTSLPHRRARLDRIMFGIVRTFLRDELRSGSVKVIQEIDPTSRTLAANALDWTLSSRNEVEYLFQAKQPVYAYDGNVLIGAFYITDSDRLRGKLYDITCTDAIGVLDDDPFPDAYYSGANAYTLATDICQGFTVEMDAALKEKTVKGVISGKTRRGALQQLCFALGSVADTSGTDTIRIYTLASDTPAAIPASRTRIGGTVRTAPIVTAVRLTAHAWSTSQSSGQQVTINGVTYYDTQTVITINNPDVTANDKPNVVEVKNATLVSPDIAAALAQHLYDWCTLRDTHSLKFRLSGELPGDYVQTVTPWGNTLTGHYVRGSITLSGFALADAEVIGT